MEEIKDIKEFRKLIEIIAKEIEENFKKINFEIKIEDIVHSKDESKTIFLFEKIGGKEKIFLDFFGERMNEEFPDFKKNNPNFNYSFRVMKKTLIGVNKDDQRN